LSLSFIDLFAGVGGTRLAFEGAGFSCVFSSEWDIHSQATYQRNFGESPKGDITAIQSHDIPEFDVLVAGFPCQPFSSFGLRQGFEHKTQGTLFHEVARILSDKRIPAYAQKINWSRVERLQDLPSHHTHGSLFLSLQGPPNWN
jgi:DNA (cytosine-5)-methyltransferase 1